MSNLLTASRLTCARACQRLHHIKYDLGYRAAITALVLRFGTLVHKGLEAWWRAAMAGLPQEQWLDAALAAMQGESDLYDLARAQVLLAGYHLRWKDEPYDVLAVEVRFELELRNPTTGHPSRTWRLAGKIDVIVRDRRTGLVHNIEHKTSSEDISPGSEYFRRLRLDGQVSIYFEGGRSLGHEIASCIYDVLGKPRHKPLEVNTRRSAPETPDEFRQRIGEAVAEEPAKYFQRCDVVRLEAEMEDALHDVWQLGQQIRESELAQRYPRNPDACSRYGRTCEFFGVCTGEASLEDAAKFIRHSEVHPELAPDVEREKSEQQEAVP